MLEGQGTHGAQHPVPFRGSRCIHIHIQYFNAEGKFAWTYIFRYLHSAQQFPWSKRMPKFDCRFDLLEDIISLVGNYNPFSSASSSFISCTLSTTFCRASNFWLILQLSFYFRSSSYFQAFTCPSVPLFTLLLLYISLPVAIPPILGWIQASFSTLFSVRLPAAGSTKSTGEAPSSSQSRSSSRAEPLKEQ